MYPSGGLFSLGMDGPRWGRMGSSDGVTRGLSPTDWRLTPEEGVGSLERISLVRLSVFWEGFTGKISTPPFPRLSVERSKCTENSPS